MEFLHYIANLILHIDHHLSVLILQYGVWTYVILFLIVFCETGLVVFPFLPGDSMLFAAGALAASAAHPLDAHILVLVLGAAAILGNTVNYFVGRLVGPHVFHSEQKSWLNKKHLQKAHDFFERYGGKTLIIARFVPIVRTVAPFVAGISAMGYLRFQVYNVIGAAAWVCGLIYASFLFGNLPFIKENFSIVVFAIIFISLLPPIVEFVRQKYF